MVAQDRADLTAEFIRGLKQYGITTISGVEKADIAAMLGAIDDFVNTNLTAFNNAIPATPRAALSPSVKALAFMFVLQKRFLKGVN
jgi:hypothetical protein